MRSPVGELVSAMRRAVVPRNDTPAPYVSRSGGPAYGGLVATGDPTQAIEAYGSNGTLFSIINKLSTSVAAVEWHMHRTTHQRTGAGCDVCEMPGVSLVPSHPAMSVWDHPNDFFTPMLFAETFQQHIDLVGEAWWVVAYLAKRPIELWPVRPDRMAPVRDPRKFIAGYVYRSPDGQLIPLRLDEVIFLRQPAPWDPYRGAGAVQTLMNNLWGAKYAAEWNRRFFENSAIPGGIVELPVSLSDPEWAQFQQRWAESHKGVSNAHTVATLEYGAKWVDVKYTQRDMEFAELRRVNREEIREAFGIHGHVLGLSEDVNRANAMAADASYGRRLIVPRCDRIKDALNGPFMKLFGAMGKGYEFCYVSPVPEDREGDDAERASKTTAFKTLIDAGVDPEDAAMVVGLPKMKMIEKAPAPMPAPPPAGAPTPPGEDDDAAEVEAVTRWIRRIAAHGVTVLDHPGHADQSVHGRKRGAGDPDSGVRESLAEAKTIGQVNSAVATEAKRITGRNVAVDFAGSDLQIAREHGEGVLRNMERYPKTPVGRVETYGEGSGRDSAFGPNDTTTFAYNTGAYVEGGVDKISFNNHFASDPDFYRFQLKNAEATGSMPRGLGTPIGIATHEFGHSVARHVDAETTAGEIAAFGKKKAGHSTAKEYIEMEIGFYATTNHQELAADAFADVQINGNLASGLSKEIVNAIDTRYRTEYGENPKS